MSEIIVLDTHIWFWWINLEFDRFPCEWLIVAIPDGEVLEGAIPKAKMKLLQAWIELHKDELVADWQLAVSGQQLYKIEPLR